MNKLVAQAKRAINSNNPKLAQDVVNQIDAALADRIGKSIEAIDNAVNTVAEEIEYIEGMRSAVSDPKYRAIIDALTDQGYKHIMGMDQVVAAGRKVYRRES